MCTNKIKNSIFAIQTGILCIMYEYGDCDTLTPEVASIKSESLLSVLIIKNCGPSCVYIYNIIIINIITHFYKIIKDLEKNYLNKPSFVISPVLGQTLNITA